MVDGSEALDCSDPWHDEGGSPAREPERGEGPTHSSGPSRDRDGFLPGRDLWRPHGCKADGADWSGRMSNLNVRIGNHALSGTNMSARRAPGPRVLRALSLLLGLLVVGSGCEAGQDPPSGSP